jgi:hypothetical protein
MGDVEFIVAPGQPYAARDLAETLAFELDLQDMPGGVTLAGAVPSPPGDPEARLPVYVVVDPSPLVSASGPLLPGPELLRRTVVVWTGPPPTASADTLTALRWAGSVFATSQRSVAALHRVGVRARLLRAGYSRRLDRFDLVAPRPLDVLFLGVSSPRRAERLAAAAAALEGSRCSLSATLDPPRADAPDAPLAAPRWDRLEQTKLVLGIHAGCDIAFPWPEMLDAIHAGAVVVCEHSSAIAPLVPGEHLLVASPDALPHVARALLRDPVRLAAIRLAAFERLRDWIPYALWASILRAAVVELIGEPLAVPAGYPEPRLTAGVRATRR